MASLSRLEALLLNVTKQFFILKFKKSEILCWLIRMHTKEKPLQSDPFDWPMYESDIEAEWI